MYNYDMFLSDFSLPKDVYEFFYARGVHTYSDYIAQGRMLYHYASERFLNLNEFEKRLMNVLLEDGSIPINDSSFDFRGCRRFLNLLRLADFFVV
ncbi:MAG: hypothetical protein K6F57_05405, partial [Candidatus Saccharibacteria bacterium]|nr:hypothetical protein [Candidatus Saccharibacteria bacterium]